MKQTLLTTLPLAIMLCSCATDSYGSGPNAGKRAMYGAAAGATIGALAGGALGSDALSGAAVGALAGGALGAAVKPPHGRQYYRDTRGFCYYIDRNGNAKYARTNRC